MVQTEKEINTRNLHEHMHESDPKIERIMVQINNSLKLKILFFVTICLVVWFVLCNFDTIISFLEEKVPVLINKYTPIWF